MTTATPAAAPTTEPDTARVHTPDPPVPSAEHGGGRPLKVMMLSDRYWPDDLGGAEISTRLSAEALVAAGHEVVVLRTRPAGKREDYTDRVVGGVRVRAVPLANIYWHPPKRRVTAAERLLWHTIDRTNPVMARMVASVVREERPDVVHSQALEGFSTAVWPAVRRCGVPVVHTTRSYYPLCPRATMRRHGENCDTQCTSCRLFTAPRRRHSRWVSGVTGISRFVLDRHLEAGYFPEAEEAVIVNPIRPPETPADSAGPNENDAAGDAATDDRPLRLGYLGRLHSTKGTDHLLERVRELPAGSYTLSIGGRGVPEYEQSLKARSADLPVTLRGRVDPTEFLRTVDLLVVPSVWNEPFGRVTVEAFAHGVPVIGSPYGGTAELIRPGETGLLFTPEEPGSLAAAVGELAGDRARLRRMGRAALADSARYRPAAVAARLVEFYRHVLDLHAARPSGG